MDSATGQSRIEAPVLLVGATGMLGRAWQQRLEADAIPFETPARHVLDLTDADTIDRAVADRFRTVINCAAYTDVDGAESDQGTAHALNADAPAHLGRACARTGALLVHYSTDYVFDGTATDPYGINDAVCPTTVYGRTKADGEDAIRNSGAEHLILRTSWLFAPWGRNFVLTMMRLLLERDEVAVVRDQRGRPTSCRTLARATADLMDAGARGTLHACNSGDCTWFDLALRIKLETSATGRVIACTSKAFPRPAQRPHYSVLDLADTERLIGPLPDWHASLDRAIADARGPALRAA